ncbi:TPA: acyl-CoA thioesterase [Candidatus Scatousia excrementigallinarum]|uniref:Acyl-CoA thioesterase n=1 Tax=Candidatus Scatousia excrementigallinarum TaxID=2840935 RepID=A0A9D1EYZ6_9BACT|nr:acyl-CoA thioesterase [Candidatus Scatousia excrementigallinarum]
MKFEAETFITVQFYDLDPMNVVWHGNYIKYLETARCDLLSKIGYDYDNMREDGIAYPVATMDLKFMKPCTFNQKLKVVSSVEEIEPCLIIKYMIYDALTGEKLFRAKTMQICIDIHSKESLYSAPERLKEKLACCNL